jgi:choline-glycine betaine transporter
MQPHFLFQGPPNFTQIGIFGLKTNHLATLFEVCTSLGLGARQLNSGFHELNSDIPADDLNIQLITLWTVTAVATV